MHVVHVIDGLASAAGGTSRAVCDLTTHLSQISSCECSIYTLPADRKELKCGPQVTIERSSNPSFFKQRNSVWDDLSRIHNRTPIDIIHTNGMWSPFVHFVASFARKNGIKQIATPHGMLEPWSLSQKKWKKKIAWWLYQKHDLKTADAIQVTAQSEAESMRKLGLDNFIIVPNGVEVRPLPQRHQRQQTALFLSRVHPKKGIPTLLRAWKRLNRNDWQLKIVGPGDKDYLQKIQRQIDKTFLDSSVQLLPAVEGHEKDRQYESASIFVLPTHSENFGIVIAEALERELPVITTTGTPWTQLDIIGCGWCIELNEDNLLDALVQATNATPEILCQMGQAGRTHIEQNFTWPAVAANLFRNYQEILGLCS